MRQLSARHESRNGHLQFVTGSPSARSEQVGACIPGVDTEAELEATQKSLDEKVKASNDAYQGFLPHLEIAAILTTGALTYQLQPLCPPEH